MITVLYLFLLVNPKNKDFRNAKKVRISFYGFFQK